MVNRLGAASRYCGLSTSSGGTETISTPARSAASASSIVKTRSIVSCRLPFMARRSATVGLLRLIESGPLCCVAVGRSADLDHHLASFDLDRIGRKIDADGRAFCLSGLV